MWEERKLKWNAQAKPSNKLLNQAGKKESPHYSLHQLNLSSVSKPVGWNSVQASILTGIKSDRNPHLLSLKKSLQTNAWGNACVVFLEIQHGGSSQFCPTSGGLCNSQLEIAEPGWPPNFWSQPGLTCFLAPLTLTSTCNLRAVKKRPVYTENGVNSCHG